MPLRPLRAVLALVVGLVGVGAAPVAAAGTGTAPAAPSLIVAPADAGRLSPTSDLSLQVAVDNPGDERLTDLTATVRLVRTPFVSPSGLEQWLAAEPEDEDSTDGSGQTLGEVTVDDVDADTTGSAVTITVPAAELGILSPEVTGPRGLSVELESGGDTIATARTAVVWNAGTPVTPTTLAAVAPLTVPPQPRGLIPAEDLAAYTGSGGVLSRQLNAALGKPVTLAIDPMIVASIRVLGTAAPESATSWLERLRQAPNETFALPYADQDVTMVAQTGAVPFPTVQSFAGRIDAANIPQPTAPPADPQPTGEPSEPVLPATEEILAWDYTLEGIAWPADDAVVPSDPAALAANGWTTSILGESDLQGTPGTVAQLGEHRALVADSTVTTLFRRAVHAPTPLEWSDAIARLSAVLAAQPGATLLAALDRSWPETAYRLGETLDTLSAGGTATTPLAALQEATASPAAVVAREPDAERRDIAAGILASDAAEAQFATVAVDPEAVTAPRRLRMLSLLSTGWRQDAAGWQAEVAEYQEESLDLREAVRIDNESAFTLGADPGELPILLRNDLRVDATVVVTATSNRAPLRVLEGTYTIDLPAGQVTRAPIKVRTIANGEVTLTVRIATVGGLPLGESAVPVNVQASWETVGTGVIAGAVIVLFAVGLVRSILRRRRSHRTPEGTVASDPPSDGDRTDG